MTRSVALVLAALTALPALAVTPTADAFHQPRTDIRDVPLLNRDGAECAPARLAALPAELEAVGEEHNEPAFYRWLYYEGTQVPMLCVNGADTAWVEALRIANDGVRAVNDAISILENASSYRREAYVPLNRTAMLKDELDGRRLGGYGEWEIVSVTGKDSTGAPASFHAARHGEQFVPDRGLRFSDPTTGTYPLLADVALVSPEIDLAAVDVPRRCTPDGTCLHYINGPRDAWEDVVTASRELAPMVRQLGSTLNVEQQLLMWEKQAAVTLSIRHRYSLALEEDGVRVELYYERPTTDVIRRASIIGPEKVEGVFVLTPSPPDCPDTQSPVPGTSSPANPTDPPAPFGDYWPSGCVPYASGADPYSGLKPDLAANAHETPLTVPSMDQYHAVNQFTSQTTGYRGVGFTGNTFYLNRDTGWANATFDLSEHAGRSVWLVFHAKTGLGLGDYFHDQSRFPIQDGYGYFLDSVNVTAKTKMHNVRVKGNDDALPRTAELAAPRLPLYNAETGKVEHTIHPPVPGEETQDVEFYVTNFGRYADVVDLTIAVKKGSSSVDERKVNRTLFPGEVWRATYPWPPPGGAREGDAFDFVVTALLSDQQGFDAQGTLEGAAGGNRSIPLNDSVITADPWQPRDERYYGVDADNKGETSLRVRRLESIVLEPPVGTSNLVDVEPAIEAKDKVRKVRTVVANAGNTVVDVRVVPFVTDPDGRSYPDFFVGGAERDLGMMDPGDRVPVEWEVRPYLTGAFRLGFSFVDASDANPRTVGVSPIRLLYVGRTAGVVCADDLYDDRGCTSNWEVEETETLLGKDVLDAWRAPSGDVWAVGREGGVFRQTNGRWLNYSDARHVPTPLPKSTSRDDLRNVSFEAVWGPSDDVVYVVGSNGTILRFDGAWREIPILSNRSTEETRKAHEARLQSLAYHDAWGADEERVFILGDDGVMLTLNRTTGASFHEILSPVNETIRAVDGPTDEAWAVGDANTIIRFDGKAWRVKDPAVASNYTPAGAAPADLRAVYVAPDGHAYAGGDYGAIYHANFGAKTWTVSRERSVGAATVTAFATSPDGDVWAFGENGLLMRCEDCAEGAASAWTALVSPAPFVERADGRPSLSEGRHLTTKGNLLGLAGSDDQVEFRVRFLDPEGRRPEYLRVHYRNATGRVETMPLTYTGFGSHQTGAEYAAVKKLKEGAYDYWFEASDGRTPVATTVQRGALGVGGDCRTGADGAPNVRNAAPRRIFPDHKPVACSGHLLTAVTPQSLQNGDDSDNFTFMARAGQRIVVTLVNSTGAQGSVIVRLRDPASESKSADPQSVTVASVAPAKAGAWFIVVERASITGTAPLDITWNVEVTLENPAPSTNPLARVTSAPSIGQLARAKATIDAVVDGESPIVFLERGRLLRFVAQDPVFENAGDWDPDYRLVPSGAPDPTHPVWPSRPVAWWAGSTAASGASLRASPIASVLAGQAWVNPTAVKPEAWDSLKLTVRHQIASTYGKQVATQNNLPVYDRPEIRASFLVTPEAHDSAVQVACTPGGSPTPQGVPEPDALCDATTKVIELFKLPHANAGWVEQSWELKKLIEDAKHVRPDTRFGGIDFYYPLVNNSQRPVEVAQWAIDEIRLVGTLNGQALTLIHWNGKDLVGSTRAYLQDEYLRLRSSSTWDVAWKTHPRPIFGHNGNSYIHSTADEGTSLWHMSKETDQPTWVANFETVPGSGKFEPGLGAKAGYQSILVTPAVDLRQTFDPVLEFKHAFLGRVSAAKRGGTGANAEDVVCLDVFDAGSVLMQIWDADANAWSRLLRLTPQGGYPARGANGAPDGSSCWSHPDVAIRHRGNQENQFDYGQGFFWYNVEPDQQGAFTGALRVANYERVRIPLDHQPVQPEPWSHRPGDKSAPTPAAGGEIVRFAFMFNASRYGDVFASTPVRPYEGWYVTGLRVLGERVLGNDLAVTNVTVKVGYDWDRIGVGPGTTVPVNVTVKNVGLYDVPGFKVRLSALQVLDSVKGITRVVATDEVRYDANVVAGERRNFTLAWTVDPLAAGASSERYVVRVEAIPLSLPDENGENNVEQIGDFVRPVIAKVSRDVRVVVGAEPRAESSSVKRYLPVMVDNVGNVPATDVVITREIAVVRGAQGIERLASETRTWRTTRPAPEGSRTIVSALADDVDVLRDLYWTPPSQANYLVTAVLNDTVGKRLTRSEVLVESHTTYLFDDAEDGPRGVAFRGAWDLAAGWSVARGAGFGGSPSAYRFGDAALRTYAPDADAPLAFPVVDITSATTAKLSFYHRFDFEDDYDGGVIEASLDGGRSWTVLRPDSRAGAAYTGALAPASPLNPGFDPRNATQAFTGSSRAIEGNLDGWVFSQVNLGQLDELVHETSYDAFDAQGQRSDAIRRCPFGAAGCGAGLPYYADGSWLVGSTATARYFQVDNLTEARIAPSDPTVGFLWSGSPRRDDDGTYPANPALDLVINLSSVSAQSDERVELRFREWMRHDAVMWGTITNSDGQHGQIMRLYQSSWLHTYRSHHDGVFNVVARDGNWWTWAVDLTDFRGKSINLSLGLRNLATWTTQQAAAPSDWGWVVDDLEVATYRLVGGQRVESGKVVTMRDVPAIAWTRDCGPTSDDQNAPCISSSTKFVRVMPAVLPSARLGPALSTDGRVAYAFGGANGAKLADVLRYDARADRVDTLPAELPSPRANASAAYDGSRYHYVVGGDAASGRLTEILRFDPVARSIEKVGDLQTARHQAAAVWAGNALYVFGGRTGLTETTRLDTIEKWRPGMSTAEVLGVKLPSSRYGAAAVWDGRYAWILGGNSAAAPGATNEVLRFEVARGAIEDVGDLPTARYGASATWTGSRILLFGGATTSATTRTADVVRINPSLIGGTGFAEKLASALPSARADGAAALLDGESFVFGGVDADGNLAQIVRYRLAAKPIADGIAGREWALVTTPLGGAPASWSVLGLADDEDRPYVNKMTDALGNKELPTGESNRVWWSGAKARLADGTADVTIAANTPGGLDSRLVTPSVDLSRVAGDSATLQFRQMHAFYSTFIPDRQVAPTAQPYGDLGLVEIQVYNRERAEWGAWKQLFKPECKRLDDVSCRGGYPTAMPVSYRKAADNAPLFVQVDVPTIYNATNKTDYVYGYMGVTRNPDPATGWSPESFDLTPFLGERVRLGFRYVTAVVAPGVRAYGGTGSTRAFNGAFHPELYGGRGSGQGGWYIDDVEVVGDTLAGKPVLLRFRAGTDGSVACRSDPDASSSAPERCAGGWEIDDLSISGATYRRNVGVFLADVPVGAGPGKFATVAGSLRNLGSGVRRNLAVEILDATLANGQPPAERLAFTPRPVAGRGTPVLNDDELHPSALIAGLNLAPRGAVDFAFQVSVPASADAAGRRILVRVVERNEATLAFQPIRDNEVEGFAEREIPFAVSGVPKAELVELDGAPAALSAGERSAISIRVVNTGLVPLRFDATCSMRRIDAFEAVDHKRTDPESIVYGPTRLCTTVAKPTVPPGQEGVVLFSVAPAIAGVHEVTVTANYTDGETEAIPISFAAGSVTTGTLRLAVDQAPVHVKDDVEDDDRRAKWIIGPADFSGTRWMADEARVHGGRWSWAGGLSDESFGSSSQLSYALGPSTTAGYSWTITTPAIDLHNVTQGPVFLRFWHQPRLARGDGADVRTQVLLNEFLPDSAWTASSVNCKLTPVGGYDGPVLSYFAPTPAGAALPERSADVNSAYVDGQTGTRTGTFASDDPSAPGNDGDKTWPQNATRRRFFTGFTNEWRLAEFRLDTATCYKDPTVDAHRRVPLALLGHTVRFQFTVYAGAADPQTGQTCPSTAGLCDPLKRGRGQGWFLDDLSISGFDLEFEPTGGAYRVLDNATKRVPTRLANPSRFADVASVRVDAAASSVPAGAATIELADPTLDPDDATLAWARVGLGRDPGFLPLVYKLRLIAASLTDPNVEAERVLTLDFSPRRWPDLRVTMEPPAAAVQEGTKAYLPITIENYGLRTSPAPKVVVVEEAGGARKVHEIPAANLREIPSYLTDSVESTLVTEFLWTPLPGRGTHRLTVVVDPDGLVEEYTKSDNSRTIEVEVTKLLQPDLVIPDDGIAIRLRGAKLTPSRDGDVVRFEAQENDLVTLEVKIRNDGPVGATNVNLRALIGPLFLPPKTLPFVEKGHEVVVPFTWLAQKGEWPLQFTVGTDLVELDDSNNRQPRAGLLILTVKGFDVTTSVAEVPKVIAPGESVVVNVTLENRGIAGEEVRLRAILPSGWTGTFETPTVFLARGRTGSSALVVPLTIAPGREAVAGEQLITVQAIATENPLKVSVGTTTARVLATYGAVVETEPFTSPPGRVRLPVTIASRGNNADPIGVAAELPHGWSLADPNAAFVVAPFARETEILEIRTSPGTPTGRYEVGLALTLGDGTRLAATVPVTIRAWRALAFEVGSGAPAGPSDRLAYDVTVTNVGNSRAPFTLLTPELPDGWSASVTPASGQLLPGTSTTVRLTVVPPDGAAAGEYPIPLYAHFDGVQPASEEGLANRDRVVVRIERPDVLVKEFSFTPRLGVKPLQRLQVRAAVENVGTTLVRDVKVSLFVDDVFIEQAVVASLAPDARREVAFNWTTTGGQHALTVVADPFRTLLDVNRENNAVARVLVVEGEQHTVRGVPAETVDVPTIAPAVALAAAVGVALLLPRRRRPNG